MLLKKYVGRNKISTIIWNIKNMIPTTTNLLFHSRVVEIAKDKEFLAIMAQVHKEALDYNHTKWHKAGQKALKNENAYKDDGTTASANDMMLLQESFDGATRLTLAVKRLGTELLAKDEANLTNYLKTFKLLFI